VTDGEDDVPHDERPRHPYTWLHLIVLALVAFVLGFLIMLLLSRSSAGAAADPTSDVPAAVSVAAGPGIDPSAT